MLNFGTVQLFVNKVNMIEIRNYFFEVKIC